MLGPVEGYEEVDVYYTSNFWGGLEYNGDKCVLDGSVNKPDWWYYAVGSTASWNSGMPGAEGVVDVTELWIFIEISAPAPVTCNQLLFIYLFLRGIRT